jgi:hypothetical protein
MGTEEFTRRWRELVGEISRPGVHAVCCGYGRAWRACGRPITVELSHRSMEVRLKRRAKTLAADLAEYEGVEDVDDGFRPGKQQIDFTRESLRGRAWDLRRVMWRARFAMPFTAPRCCASSGGAMRLRSWCVLPIQDRKSEQMIYDLYDPDTERAHVHTVQGHCEYGSGPRLYHY